MARMYQTQKRVKYDANTHLEMQTDQKNALVAVLDIGTYTLVEIDPHIVKITITSFDHQNHF